MKVSVLMITYNQESYISKAIDSVLMQDVDFDYEIVIGDDHSTDKTASIIQKYEIEQKTNINFIENKRNVGAIQNLINTFNHCRGDYIAILEGDDYWTSNTKLKRQAILLDSHPEFALCFHPANVIDESNPKNSYVIRPPAIKDFYTIEDLLDDNFIPTCSVMFRKGLIQRFPDWYHTLKLGDWSLHILNAMHGNIGFIDEPMSTYRIHPSGMWSGENHITKINFIIKAYKTFNAHLNYKYDRIIRKKIYIYTLELAKIHANSGDRKTMNDVFKTFTAEYSESNPGKKLWCWLHIYKTKIVIFINGIPIRIKKAMQQWILKCS